MRRSIFAAPALLLLLACAAPQPLPPAAPRPPSPPAAPSTALAAVPPTAAPVPAPAAALDPRAQRLVRLCELWGRVRYHHPAVAAGAVDWDAALVAALPKALAAQTDADELAAAQALLDALHDPATRVDPSPSHDDEATPTPRAEPKPIDGVLVARVAPATWGEIHAEASRLGKLVAESNAPLAVIDLRASSRDHASFARMALDEAAPHLVSHESAAPAQRFVEHRGYRPQVGSTSGGYASVMATEMPPRFEPDKGPHPRQVVFLTNRDGGVPDVAWAMQRVGDARIVSQGPLGPDEGAYVDDAPFGAGVVHVRESRTDGPELAVDATIAEGLAEDAAIAAAVKVAKRPKAKRATASSPPAEVTWRPDAAYPEEALPSRERRLLALFRFWNVIHLFYPYLPLMGSDWDQALVDFLPRFESASSVREYQLAVAELAARIPDGHVYVGGAIDLPDVLGHGWLPFAARVIEGEVVVTALLDDAALAGSGLAIGDVITAVEGEPMAARRARLAKYTAASNETWRAYNASFRAVASARGDRVPLTVRDATGTLRELSVARPAKRPPPERTGDVVRLLGDDVGYVDLGRLEGGDVDAMFTKLEKTKAIVFDMRGYPHGTAWSIGPRLNVRGAKAFARFFEPLVTVGHPTLSAFDQPIAPASKPLYRGKTVMLIDERTMSQAEHTGLYFEAANGTAFIGSQTAGANGDITSLTLPGGLSVGFTGHDVRHADGRQLQRVGLVPDVEVHPTIAGLRAGKDEVLDRALVYVRTGK